MCHVGSLLPLLYLSLELGRCEIPAPSFSLNRPCFSHLFFFFFNKFILHTLAEYFDPQRLHGRPLNWFSSLATKFTRQIQPRKTKILLYILHHRCDSQAQKTGQQQNQRGLLLHQEIYFLLTLFLSAAEKWELGRSRRSIMKHQRDQKSSNLELK
ncbi:hypothetical protein ABKV19_010422 [Rosa sericea]